MSTTVTLPPPKLAVGQHRRAIPVKGDGRTHMRLARQRKAGNAPTHVQIHLRGAGGVVLCPRGSDRMPAGVKVKSSSRSSSGVRRTPESRVWRCLHPFVVVHQTVKNGRCGWVMKSPTILECPSESPQSCDAARHQQTADGLDAVFLSSVVTL